MYKKIITILWFLVINLVTNIVTNIVKINNNIFVKTDLNMKNVQQLWLLMAPERYEIITIMRSMWFITLTDDFSSSFFKNFFTRVEKRRWRRRIAKVKPILTGRIHHITRDPSAKHPQLLRVDITTCPRDDTSLPPMSGLRPFHT